MLVLFYIDATLLVTSRSGLRAMRDAGVDLHGPRFDTHHVEFAGRLDPLIVRDLLQANGVDATPPAMSAFRARYREHLARRLGVPGVAKALPGVPALLAALGTRTDVVMGLLTGNFAETGRMKLEASGIDPAPFKVCAWGDESPHDPPDREHLPPVAVARFEALRGRRPRRVTIVGDTPHDARCARANACRCLGVATGLHDAGALRRAGADLVLADLSDTERIMAFLTAQEPTGAD